MWDDVRAQRGGWEQEEKERVRVGLNAGVQSGLMQDISNSRPELCLQKHAHKHRHKRGVGGQRYSRGLRLKREAINNFNHTHRTLTDLEMVMSA